MMKIGMEWQKFFYDLVPTVIRNKNGTSREGEEEEEDIDKEDRLEKLLMHRKKHCHGRCSNALEILFIQVIAAG